MLASSVINVHVYTRAIKLTENVLKVSFVSSTFNWLRGSGEGIIYLLYAPSKDDFSLVDLGVQLEHLTVKVHIHGNLYT